MKGKYKLAVCVEYPNNLTYGGRYIQFSEVLGVQNIELTESYASLAIF